MGHPSIGNWSWASWILRFTQGKSQGKSPDKIAFKIGSTGVTSTMTPSILKPKSSWARFLHETNGGEEDSRSKLEWYQRWDSEESVL